MISFDFIWNDLFIEYNLFNAIILLMFSVGIKIVSWEFISQQCFNFALSCPSTPGYQCAWVKWIGWKRNDITLCVIHWDIVGLSPSRMVDNASKLEPKLFIEYLFCLVHTENYLLSIIT